MALPPRSRLPAVAQMAWLSRDPIGFLTASRRRLGPIFQANFFGVDDLVYVAEPELARQVFATDRDIGLAGAARMPYLEPVVGAEGLLCTDGEKWQRQRRLLGPPFHGEAIERYGEQIAEITAGAVEGWPVGEPFGLRPRAQGIALEVILRVVFGIRDTSRLGRLRELFTRKEPEWVVLMPPRVRAGLDRLRRLGGPFERRNPWARFLEIRDEVDAILFDEIERRRAAPDLSERDDVLSLLLQARDEDGSALSDRELRDELMTLLVAGNETTATAVAWAFERLVRTPRAAERLRESVDAGDESYAALVARETLRLRPVLFDVVRVIDAPMSLGGYDLPEGTWLAPAIALIHLDPEVYEDPHEFRPERFEDGAPPYPSWIPFGGGRRRCVGSHLALLEMQKIVAGIAGRFELRAADPRPERGRLRHITLVPEHEGRVVALPRRGAARAAERAATTA